MAHEIIMPALGMAQETGRLVAWLKNEGDTVKKGEPLMEVETDKSTMEVEAPRDGFLVNVLPDCSIVYNIVQYCSMRNQVPFFGVCHQRYFDLT